MTQYAQPRRPYGGNPAGAGSSFLWGMGHAGRKKKEQQKMLLEMFKAGFTPKKSDKPKAGGWRGAMQNIGEAWSPRMPEFEMAPHHPVVANREAQKSDQGFQLTFAGAKADLARKQADQQYRYDRNLLNRKLGNEKEIANMQNRLAQAAQRLDREKFAHGRSVSLREIANAEDRAAIEKLVAMSGIDVNNAQITKLNKDSYFIEGVGGGNAIVLNTATGDATGMSTWGGETWSDKDPKPRSAQINDEIAIAMTNALSADKMDDDALKDSFLEQVKILQKEQASLGKDKSKTSTTLGDEKSLLNSLIPGFEDDDTSNDGVKDEVVNSADDVVSPSVSGEQDSNRGDQGAVELDSEAQTQLEAMFPGGLDSGMSGPNTADRALGELVQSGSSGTPPPYGGMIPSAGGGWIDPNRSPSMSVRQQHGYNMQPNYLQAQMQSQGILQRLLQQMAGQKRMSPLGPRSQGPRVPEGFIAPPNTTQPVPFVRSLPSVHRMME